MATTKNNKVHGGIKTLVKRFGEEYCVNAIKRYVAWREGWREREAERRAERAKAAKKHSKKAA